MLLSSRYKGMNTKCFVADICNMGMSSCVAFRTWIFTFLVAVKLFLLLELGFISFFVAARVRQLGRNAHFLLLLRAWI